jgi:hypothetical protein
MSTAPLRVLVSFAALACSACAVGGRDTLTDESLMAIATSPYDKGRMAFRKVELGRHHGVVVVAEFPCSDLCPAYTTRVIHYDVPSEDGAGCAKIGGSIEPVPVPMGIGRGLAFYCLPKVLGRQLHASRSIIDA